MQITPALAQKIAKPAKEQIIRDLEIRFIEPIYSSIEVAARKYGSVEYQAKINLAAVKDVSKADTCREAGEQIIALLERSPWADNYKTVSRTDSFLIILFFWSVESTQPKDPNN